MNNMMSYKGYIGSVHYSDDDGVFYGKIEFIRSLVSYEGTSVASLHKAFRNAVDDYLELCNEQGHKPEQPFKGSFNVRIKSDLHRRAAMLAKESGTNLNKVVTDALENYLNPKSPA